MTEHSTGGEPPVTGTRRPAQSQPSTPRDPPDIPVVTILVVEPEFFARMAIAQYLRMCGYKAMEADKIDEALQVLQSDAKVDVVFAEVSALGAGEGFALAKKIRESYPTVDVILTSNIAQAADKAGELCDNGVLNKPYRPEELVRRIRVLHELRRSSGL